MVSLDDEFFKQIGLIGTILGFFSIFIGIIFKLFKFRKLSKEMSKWQKEIKGVWYSYNTSYIDNKKIITGYEWKFKYNWLKDKFTGKAQSLRDKSVGYDKVELNFEGDYIFATAKGIHKGEYIFLILHEDYPISETNKINAVATGLSYKSKIPFTTEMPFVKNMPDLKKLNEEKVFKDLTSRQFKI